MSILLTLFICLTLAYLLSEIAKHLRLPRVMGQIIAGMIIGLPLIKAQLFSAESTEAMTSLANIGFVLLLFFAGLETNFTRFVKHLKEGAYVSLFNTLLPFAVGIGITLAFGYTLSVALIVGIALSVSAAAVSIDVLEELNILKTRLANVIMSINAVDDIIEFFIIAIVLALGNFFFIEGSLLQLGVQVIIFLILVLVFKAFLIPLILHTVEKEKSATALFYGSLIIALLMAALSDILGLGSLIGALLAGIFVRKILLSGKERRPWEEHEIANTIHTITFGFFAPIFFIYVGMNAAVFQQINIPFTILITLIALGGTLVGTLIGTLLSGGAYKEGVLLGWAFGNKGDTDLIVATIALQHSIINQSIFTSIVIMGICSTVISVIVFRSSLKRNCKYFKTC